jgi:hypothetical protein
MGKTAEFREHPISDGNISEILDQMYFKIIFRCDAGSQMRMENIKILGQNSLASVPLICSGSNSKSAVLN